MLRNVRGICSPETFTALLAIFDSAWIEISSAPDFNQETIEKQRTRLAQLVMAQMERNDLAQTEKVRDEIVRMFAEQGRATARCRTEKTNRRTR
jgi:O-succinylbenzoate synthase